ncbi:MAG: rhodanese-related sulfurtransferase [Myxococcota bacterium]
MLILKLTVESENLKYLVLSLSLAAFGCATTANNTTAGAPGTETAPIAKKVDVSDLTWTQVSEAVASGALLVDVRSSSDFEAGHIDGAINAPLDDQSSFDGLKNHVNKHVIFYASGVVSNLSRKAAKHAVDAGFSSVSEYRDGFSGWLMNM